MVGLLELQKLFNGNGFIEWLIVSIIGAILLSSFNILIYTRIFSINSSIKKNIVIVIIDALIRVVTSIFISAPFYRIVNIFTTILLFKISYKSKWEKCILGESINAITIVCTESIFSKVFCNMLNHIDTYFNGMYDYKYKGYLTIAITLCRALFYLMLVKRDFKINIPDELDKKSRISIISSSVIGMAIIFFNALEMSIFEVNFPFIILVLDIISLIFYFYFSMKSIIKIAKIQEQNLIIGNLESYNNTLSIMYDSIRGFRHDFNNIIQALKGYVDIENLDGIKRMSQTLVNECKEINNMALLDPNIIKNPAIYSIITNKFYIASQEDIQLNIEIAMDFEQIEMYTYEISRILGILLDNAIEAAKECEEKIINLRFVYDFNSDRNLIIIENTYNNKNIEIDKIFEKGYTSKKDVKKDEHGLGLWNVKKLLKKTKALNLSTYKDELFCQQIEIYSEYSKE